MRARAAPYVTPQEIEALGYDSTLYIGRGGGIIVDKGKKQFVVTDKIALSRASKPIGTKNKSTSTKSKKELQEALHRLLDGKKWTAQLGKQIGWTDPSKLEDGKHSYGSKGYTISKIKALQIYLSQNNSSEGDAGPAAV